MVKVFCKATRDFPLAFSDPSSCLSTIPTSNSRKMFSLGSLQPRLAHSALELQPGKKCLRENRQENLQSVSRINLSADLYNISPTKNRPFSTGRFISFLYQNDIFYLGRYCTISLSESPVIFGFTDLCTCS